MGGCRPPKQGFIAMVCDSKLHTLLRGDQHEIEYWLENNKVGIDDIESQKNQACFQTQGTDV